MTTQDIITGKSLFQDYNIEEEVSGSSKQRAMALDYNKIKKDRVSIMSRRSQDPRLSLDADAATGIVGTVPHYQHMKNTYKEHVRPFLGGGFKFRTIGDQKSRMNDQQVSKVVEWSKVTDPLQSMRILDTIGPSDTQFEF